MGVLSFHHGRCNKPVQKLLGTYGMAVEERSDHHTPALKKNHKLHLTAGYDITTPIEVPQLSPYESYCTLGAYLSPSGDSKVASTILRKKAVKQSSQVSKEAALWSHVLYLQPKLTFPIIAMTLTEAQYLHIPSPAIMAILPKLHLNHHTARSIVHGPLHYGGLGLPHSYSSQGLGPLKFLLGYLRAQDKTCKLILICHGYLQHLLRISTNLLNSSYQSLHTLACPTWLVSAWKFMSRL